MKKKFKLNLQQIELIELIVNNGSRAEIRLKKNDFVIVEIVRKNKG